MWKYRKIVEKHFNLNISRKCRKFRYIFARACYYHLCRKFTAYSLHDIAKSLNVNHATVINGLNKLEGMIQCKDYNLILYNSLMRKFNPKMQKDTPKITLNQLVRDYNLLLLENDMKDIKIKELEDLIYRLADLE